MEGNAEGDIEGVLRGSRYGILHFGQAAESQPIAGGGVADGKLRPLQKKKMIRRAERCLCVGDADFLASYLRIRILHRAFSCFFSGGRGRQQESCRAKGQLVCEEEKARLFRA